MGHSNAAALDFTSDQIRTILNNVHKLPPKEQAETIELLTEIADRKSATNSRKSLLAFAQRMAPVLQIETEPKVFMVGPHHKKLAQLMDAVARGEKRRILISVAPRFGKSLMTSYLFPAWYLGQFPNRRVIMASHTGDMAVGFGRKVRDLIATPEYRSVFPDVELKADSKAAGQWSTNGGGEYYAVGVGGALAGRGANLVVIDDPFSEQVVMAGNTQVFEDAWSWFQTGPLQRLAPDGACLIIHCMVGDTQVLLPDGSAKNLREIQVGEEIATYDNGKITKAKVLNWKNQGPDKVLAIRMKSGIIVRANKRHPFLVQRGDNTEWVQSQHLKAGEHILRVTGENTKAWRALLRGAVSKLRAEGCAPRTTTRLDGLLVNALHRSTRVLGKIITSNIVTVSGWLSTRLCLQNKMAFALSADCHPDQTCASIGRTNCALITTTIREKFAACYATIVISLLGTGKQQQSYCQQLSTYSVTPDEIISITPDGEEDVFDIQVEGTENFIANGLVSHNTRWNKGDLIGRLQAQMAKDPETEQWDVVEFPAIFGEGEEQKSLWPERWPLNLLLQKKAQMALTFWNAQYMQNPTGEEGALIKREWWMDWEKEDPPSCDYLIMSVDAAQETNNRADYTAWQMWGVWYDDREVANLICLDAWKQRMEYTELKKNMLEEYKRWEPDTFVIEKKSSGSVLYQELRNTGVPVSEFTPGKGQDKIARVNSVSDIFASGLVWIPKSKRWAMEVIEECADFPNGDHDDQVDAMTLAVRRFRTGGFIRLDTDAKDEDSGWKRKRSYY